ncbi:MAG: AAA family ATPase [Bacteroidaceae bacterium]|jgi:exodeoxyribonuclease-5|nr:AAA family ATPase [Bacteroidaceae bacterium]MBQ2292937.1 AAA family ATPase [Bacteroidaceae bacterium]MBQ5621535.1 AAA family ATPase [Bacteroidaceae bacterium]MBQ5681676.1 AAA family ATPase [Bacteroidaceae bacterium]MBQ5872486.1 AAA family ATPase [Bacteroidaceae bacterium]
MAITDDLGALIRENFLHNPTKEQEKAISLLSDFLLSREQDSIFLLKGYAGTGKTSLLAALVRTMQQLRLRVMLLAPTGRAAKVLSNYAGAPAFTIHRKIYRQKSITEMDVFQNNINMRQDTLFIVDEASMIANDAHEQTMFGTGRLLDDLMQYVYSCNGCRLLLVGDTAQLPPVGETESPALSRTMLEGYGMEVTELCLTQVVRQLEESGILWNATMLRSLIQNDDVYAFPKLRGKSFPDIKVLPGNELIEALEQSYRNHGTDGTIVVTRSNKRANIFNNGIRTRILDYETELSGGDLIMVAKNNYYWTEREQAANGVAADAMTFIANGDVAIVRRMRNERSFYGFRFADVTLCFPDYDHRELDVTILLDTLQSESPALTRQQQETLFNGVWEDYPELTNKRDRMKRLRQDIYYNALQIKYAYAVTCHKAQGGQWEHVYIDQGYINEEMLSPDYFRWLYTAITRATEQVYLVNWPDNALRDA